MKHLLVYFCRWFSGLLVFVLGVAAILGISTAVTWLIQSGALPDLVTSVFEWAFAALGGVVAVVLLIALPWEAGKYVCPRWPPENR